MPLQSPLTQPAHDDMHAILTHYEAKEAGLGHRIADRLRDKLRRGTLRGDSYRPYDYEPGSEGCMWCTVAQEMERIKPDERPTVSPSAMASEWRLRMRNCGDDDDAERFVINHIRQGMTPANNPAADALDACLEDWLIANQTPITRSEAILATAAPSIQEALKEAQTP